MGFGVRPDAKSRQLAERDGVEIKLYEVIYNAVDDVRAALEGMLSPEQRETISGERRGARDLPHQGPGDDRRVPRE